MRCNRTYRAGACVSFWSKCEVCDVRYLVAIRGNADVADIALCRCGGHRRRAARGRAPQISWRAALVPRGCCERHFFPAYNPRAVLLRQQSICDNQCHHARENQQCREGFSDHWPRRLARSRWSGPRFRPSLGPLDFALCRWRASLWFWCLAHASHLAVIGAVDLANSQGVDSASLIVSSRVR